MRDDLQQLARVIQRKGAAQLVLDALLLIARGDDDTDPRQLLRHGEIHRHPGGEQQDGRIEKVAESTSDCAEPEGGFQQVPQRQVSFSASARLLYSRS